MTRLSIENLETRNMMAAVSVVEAPVGPEPELQAAIVLEVETDAARQLTNSPGCDEGCLDSPIATSEAMSVTPPRWAVDRATPLISPEAAGITHVASIGDLDNDAVEDLMARIGDSGRDGPLTVLDHSPPQHRSVVATDSAEVHPRRTGLGRVA